MPLHDNIDNYPECTANGAKEMMAENTLTFLPLDDPDKNVMKNIFLLIFIITLKRVVLISKFY